MAVAVVVVVAAAVVVVVVVIVVVVVDVVVSTAVMIVVSPVIIVIIILIFFRVSVNDSSHDSSPQNPKPQTPNPNPELFLHVGAFLACRQVGAPFRPLVASRRGSQKRGTSIPGKGLGFRVRVLGFGGVGFRV